MQPKGREFEPRTLHTFLHGISLLPHLRGAIALADTLASVAPTFGVDSAAYVAIRAVMYVAALTIIGSCAFVLLIATRVSHLSGSHPALTTILPATRRLARWATALLALVLLARLLAQGYMLGEGGAVILVPLLRDTMWGWGWLVGAAATVVIAGALTNARGARVTWQVAAAGTIALALSFSLTGHATSAPTSPTAHVLLDSVHVMAAGGWLGTLFVVATIGLRSVMMLPIDARGRAAAELISAFSAFAITCVVTLAVTGGVAAWSQLPTIAALWQTPYGSALFRKLVVIGLTGLVGIYNWRVVKPRLSSAAAIPTLRRSATVELSIGLVVVILTAILVGTSPPDADETPIASAPRVTSVCGAQILARVPSPL